MCTCLSTQNKGKDTYLSHLHLPVFTTKNLNPSTARNNPKTAQSEPVTRSTSGAGRCGHRNAERKPVKNSTSGHNAPIHLDKYQQWPNQYSYPIVDESSREHCGGIKIGPSQLPTSLIVRQTARRPGGIIFTRFDMGFLSEGQLEWRFMPSLVKSYCLCFP